jgi:hypothetical protein
MMNAVQEATPVANTAAQEPTQTVKTTAASAKKSAATASKAKAAKAKPPATPKSKADAPKASAPKETKAKKPKLVRDSFTIPKDEYAVIEALKQRAVSLAHPVKKSELLRAGLKLLAGLPDAGLRTALEAVPSIKTGRPTKEAQASEASTAQPSKAKPAPKSRAKQ